MNMKKTFKTYLTEAVVAMEWRKSRPQYKLETPNLCLFKKYKPDGEFEYGATFVKADAKGYLYYSMQVAYYGDRIEFGGEHTKMKIFKTRTDVNHFLKGIGLPEVSDELFNTLHKPDELVVGFQNMTSKDPMMDDCMIFTKSWLDTAKKKSNTLQDFYNEVLMVLKKETSHWSISPVRSIDRLYKKSVEDLKNFYEHGTIPKF
jgi:hypothetical protein